MSDSSRQTNSIILHLAFKAVEMATFLNERLVQVPEFPSVQRVHDFSFSLNIKECDVP